MPGHDRVVDLLDRAFLEGPLHDRVRELGLGNHHRTRRAHVESVNDPLALRRAVARDAVSRGLQVAQDRGAFPPRSGMCGDTDRLIDDDNILVVIQDRHVGDRSRLILRLRDRHLDDIEGSEAIRFPRSNAINEDVPLPRQLRAARARQPEHAGQRGVNPLAHQRIGHGQHA